MKSNPHRARDGILSASLLVLASHDDLPTGAEQILYAASRRLKKLSELPDPNDVCPECGARCSGSTNKFDPRHEVFHNTCPNGHHWPNNTLGEGDGYESWR